MMSQMSEALPSHRKISDEQFAFLAKYLSSKYGLRVPPEKRILLESRLISRLNSLKFDSITEYLDYVFKSKEAHHEYQLFVEQITTHKTFFFREAYQFDYLTKLLPDYTQKVGVNHVVNIWSAGCSTGEEVYTLGMVLNEKRATMPHLDFRITGTDVSVPSLKKAAKGLYSIIESENIPDNLKTKYFNNQMTAHGPMINFSNREVVAKIRLGVLNLNKKHYNLPNTFDFIFCRNVIIYFDAKTRSEVLERMVERLRPGGYLFLGHSETALGTNLPLKSIQPTIYQKI
ncbi:CheR family methyltransferase [Pseudochryseolinea flava]|uniref:protein-glutamate O-methyltransferase n=1 Tax=Pseudochryseolinea flava TaxID=2059302 RepID=A0A364Y059_9BACT|nr:CheR family methyltransferase [Pseudochryseolinea flava]RAW00035.1 chemotaxis protein CheR [Pseudochryseolinea flava]